MEKNNYNGQGSAEKIDNEDVKLEGETNHMVPFTKFPLLEEWKIAEKGILKNEKKSNGGGGDGGGGDGGGGDDDNNGGGHGKRGNGNGNGSDKNKGGRGGSGSGSGGGEMKGNRMDFMGGPSFGYKYGYHAGNENGHPVGQLQCAQGVES